MKDTYYQAMDTIKASELFKKETLHKATERRYYMNNKKILVALAACFILAVGIIGFNPNETPIDLTDRIGVGEAMMGKATVNIEGTIVEVSEDGLSFKLDNGKWVKITDKTTLGITGPTAAPKEEQFFEPNFRVGNMIAGFAIDTETEIIEAYAIYTNWNWDDPIK